MPAEMCRATVGSRGRDELNTCMMPAMRTMKPSPGGSAAGWWYSSMTSSPAGRPFHVICRNEGLHAWHRQWSRNPPPCMARLVSFLPGMSLARTRMQLCAQRVLFRLCSGEYMTNSPPQDILKSLQPEPVIISTPAAGHDGEKVW